MVSDTRTINNTKKKKNELKQQQKTLMIDEI